MKTPQLLLAILLSNPKACAKSHIALSNQIKLAMKRIHKEKDNPSLTMAERIVLDRKLLIVQRLGTEVIKATFTLEDLFQQLEDPTAPFSMEEFLRYTSDLPASTPDPE